MIEFLYHITDRRNLALIEASGRLISAATAISESLLSPAAQAETIRGVRRASVPLSRSDFGVGIWLNNQMPLVPFDATPGIQEYVTLLNQHVFFWPVSPIGSYSRNQLKKDRAVRAAANFRKRYDPRPAGSKYLLIRAKFVAVAARNAARGPLFSEWNTGAPDRRLAGNRADRGWLAAEVFAPYPSDGGRIEGGEQERG